VVVVAAVTEVGPGIAALWKSSKSSSSSNPLDVAAGAFPFPLVAVEVILTGPSSSSKLNKSCTFCAGGGGGSSFLLCLLGIELLLLALAPPSSNSSYSSNC